MDRQVLLLAYHLLVRPSLPPMTLTNEQVTEMLAGLTCMVCRVASGTKVVCDGCRPYLNDNQKDRAMKLVHELTVKRDGERCVYCGRTPSNERGAGWESGELCANHEKTQGAYPELRYDLSITSSSCKICNGKHADGKFPSQQGRK